MTIPAWYADAACAEVGSDLWFPEKGDNPARAKAICAACPVARECADYAIADPGLFGIWGGTTVKERQQIRARRAAA